MTRTWMKVVLPATLAVGWLVSAPVVRGQTTRLVDPAAAEARRVELDWCRGVFLKTYDKVGHKSPKWDVPAKRALQCEVRKWAFDVTQTSDEDDQMWESSRRALDAKCDDPVVLYVAARAAERFGEGRRNASLAVRAAEGMSGEDYPLILRFYANCHAAEALGTPTDDKGEARHKGGNPDRAERFLEAARDLIPKLAADESIPRRRVMDAFVAYADAANAVHGEERDAFLSACEVFAKASADQSLVYTLQAQFANRWAWSARGGGWASEVTPEGWKDFEHWTGIAKDAAEQAWRVDPKNYLAAFEMMDVGLADSYKRPEMDQWHARAVAGNPDAYGVDRGMLNYLEPKWDGSIDDMLAFGRECVATQDWQRMRPLILVDAYLAAAHYDGDKQWQPKPRPEYFRENPKAFEEIRPVYEEYLRRHPKAIFHRERYAFIAAWSQRWETAGREFDALGGKWSGLWGGEQEMKRMRAKVRSHLPATRGVATAREAKGGETDGE